jgi:glycosyltransferase involved in cell wall biosynthesis
MTFRGHQCVVFAANKDTDMPAAFPVPESTKIIAISINTSEEGRRELESKVLGERPDVFVIMTGLAGDIPLWCLLSLKNAKIPLVASEHGCPEFIEQSWDRHQRLVYLNSVDCIHLLLDSYRKSLPEFLQDRVTVIPNPVNPMPVQDPSKDGPTAEKIIIAVGTLYTKQPKQMHFLVEAFALLKDKFPDWKVHIYGSGPDKKKIKRLIRQRGLSDRVFLCGVVDDIERQLVAAELFCIPSSHEGCPCALQEAMACGLPSIGFADCSGVNELIADGETGFLAKKIAIESLASAMGQLMGSPDLRAAMGRSAKERSQKFFSESLYDQWEALLNEASQKAGNTRVAAQVEFEGPMCLRYELERLARRKHLCSDEQVDMFLSSSSWRLLVFARSTASKIFKSVFLRA